MSGTNHPMGACHFEDTVDGRTFTPLWSYRKPLFVVVYRGIMPGSRRQCEMYFVHPQYQYPFGGGSCNGVIPIRHLGLTWGGGIPMWGGKPI